MLTMRELREKIRICTKERNSFSTAQLKELLRDMGYIYNTDYNVTIFSNAISSLVNQKYIVSLDSDRKGNYKVIKNEEKANDKNPKEKAPYNNEPELAEMRADITTCLNTTLEKIEKKLDSVKPSTYGRNIKTYNDILRLIEILREFDFTVKDK